MTDGSPDLLTPDPSTEPVEVIDADGAVIELVTRAQMRAGNLRHRTVFVVVVDRSGATLVHRRAEWKDVWPGRWDLAAGGVVAPGEPWAVAAARELVEELGVTAELEWLGEGSYEDDDVREHAHVYRAVSDGPFTYDDDEVAEAYLVEAENLGDWLATHDICPDTRAIVLPLLGPLLAPGVPEAR